MTILSLGLIMYYSLRYTVDFQIPRGMKDWDVDNYKYLEYVRNMFLENCNIYNFNLMEPSPIEMLSTLEARSGQDIQNEIYFFKDKNDRDLALRFDLTVGTARHVCSKKNVSLPIKVGTFSSMFRYDEPQHGRSRWFYQCNTEIFGSKEIDSDAEIIDFASNLFSKIGIDCIIEIGDRTLIESFIKKQFSNIDSQKTENLFRLLDKMNKNTKNELYSHAKEYSIENDEVDILFDFVKTTQMSLDSISEYLGKDNDLNQLVDLLQDRGLTNFKINPGIVRGLDYYNGIVFEIFDKNNYELGALGGGGRYDTLPKIFGRDDLGATGFAAGVDRIILSLKKKNFVLDRPGTLFSVCYIGEQNKPVAYKIAKKLRNLNLSTTYDFAEKNLKKQLHKASESGVDYVLLIAPNEIAQSEIICRDMNSRTETKVSVSNIEDYVMKLSSHNQ